MRCLVPRIVPQGPETSYKLYEWGRELRKGVRPLVTSAHYQWQAHILTYASVHYSCQDEGDLLACRLGGGSVTAVSTAVMANSKYRKGIRREKTFRGTRPSSALGVIGRDDRCGVLAGCY